uniref:Uncharacterized protein n=1 Tax=Mustela putorius furo TaxID=9669 RepID=M3Y5X8_MUSPF
MRQMYFTAKSQTGSSRKPSLTTRTGDGGGQGGQGAHFACVSSTFPAVVLPHRSGKACLPVYPSMSSPGPEVHIVLISMSPAPNSNPHSEDSRPTLKPMGG